MLRADRPHETLEVMENWRIDLVDQWNDGAIVGTFATPADAYEAIRKLG